MFVFVLSACDSNNIDNELSGKTFNIAYTPVPIKEDVNDPSKYQSFMKLEFLDDNKVSHEVYDGIEGTYKLNDNSLIITFENENEKLKITFVDFKESEIEFSTYSALISDTESDIKDPNKVEELKLITNKLHVNMPVEFIELK